VLADYSVTHGQSELGCQFRISKQKKKTRNKFNYATSVQKHNNNCLRKPKSLVTNCLTLLQHFNSAEASVSRVTKNCEKRIRYNRSPISGRLGADKSKLHSGRDCKRGAVVSLTQEGFNPRNTNAERRRSR
jgi:hypothetical protein